ncbi:GNAT family N-acetyltransferase [Nocardiopsis sp. RV163]|uniref:GNAT family N-acetyltransferase n=1 Tax=Nocardiopsis sp. RV163 TaxID=1661388 RepID=UPI00064C277F|nr:GNAT family N-acetyltransferase [Nocardiopsis sp. RV163]
MRIRPADDTDLPGLRALAAAAETVYAPDGDVLLVAADDDGLPVGWLAGTFDGVYPGPGAPVRPPHGYVQAVVVDPAARRAGVGLQLLDAFTAAARESGLEWVFAVPDEAPGVAGRVAWLSASGFTPVADPGELWPVMGRWTEPGR